MQIRSANIADIPAMVAAGELLHGVAPRVTPYNPAAMAVFLRRALLSKNGAAWLVDAKAGTVGGLFATFQAHPFGFGDVGIEWALWLPEGWRGAGAARALIEAYVAEGRARGCFAVQLTSLATNDRAGVLYKRMGFVEHETHYVRVL